MPARYPRSYRITTPGGKTKAAYRIVVSPARTASTTASRARPGSTRRSSTPAADRRTINGRKLQLYYDGTRLRLVAWRTPRAVYWVLEHAAADDSTNQQMLAIAGSLTRLGTDR